MTDHRVKRYQLSEGIRLGLNAAAALVCAGLTIMAFFATINGAWDAATTLFVAAILMRMFIRD
jgi:hypothetical protein